MKKTVFLFFILTSYIVVAQDFVKTYQTRADLVSQDSINNYLCQFEKLGIKTTGSLGNTSTLDWIKKKYLSYGYLHEQILEDSFHYKESEKMIFSKNLIVTKKGTLYPDKYIIVCGHFDSINGPGVNDNGSGTSVILEAARILQNISTEYSVKFIHFSGEEQRGKGSSHYVNNVVFKDNVQQLDIRLVLNLDQVGGKKGNNNTTVYCEKDEEGKPENNALSASVTKQLMICTELYSSLKAQSAPTYNSDYMAFENKGFVITGLYEYPESGNEHTVNDTFANTDPHYIYHVCRTTIGALQHFAVAVKWHIR